MHSSENCQLQNTIEQLRIKYITTLGNHLKRLPEDFRGESRILNEAHIERYRSKSCAKRFMNEREELKKRIQFATMNEKQQIKHLNNFPEEVGLILIEIIKKELNMMNGK